MSSRKRTRSPVPVAVATPSSVAVAGAVVDPESGEKKRRCSDSKLETTVAAVTVTTSAAAAAAAATAAAAAAAATAAADALYKEAQDCKYGQRGDLLRRAAESGHAMACIEYAWMFDIAAERVPWWRAAITHAQGQSNESLINSVAYLQLGQYVSRDWWRRGALLGYRDCLTSYAECLYRGDRVHEQVVAQDIPQALRLFRSAVLQDCGTSMEHLGNPSSHLPLVCNQYPSLGVIGRHYDRQGDEKSAVEWYETSDPEYTESPRFRLGDTDADFVWPHS